MTAYWLAMVDVHDEDAYQGYAQRAPAAVEAYGGRVLARGGERVGLEGAAPPGRVVIIEFDSVEQAEACFNSPEYQAARAHRIDAADARFMIVDGLE